MTTKILTVDDSRAIRMIIQRVFSEYDCTFTEAANGELGLAAATRDQPDLILLDITMPVMDGLTMLEKLRQEPSLKSTPVIMLTAESSGDTVAQAAQFGISDYLAKPFKDPQLIEKVTRLIKLQPKAAPMAAKA